MKCRKCHQEIPDGSRFCLRCGAPQQVSQNTKSRGNGTGSVYKRGATWTAVRVLRYTTDEAGHLHKTTASKGGFRTKKEALEYLPKLFAEERQKRRMTWQQVYTSWQPTHRAGKSTMDCYSAANKWFRPLWPLWFDDIDIDDLQACLDDCQKGRRTRENMKALAGLLYKAFQQRPELFEDLHFPNVNSIAVHAKLVCILPFCFFLKEQRLKQG